MSKTNNKIIENKEEKSKIDIQEAERKMETNDKIIEEIKDNLDSEYLMGTQSSSEENVRNILSQALKEQREEMFDDFLSTLDDDSCECDNCQRTRDYFKNSKKEVLRYNNKLNAELKTQREAPMGVSQWANHGKEHGYWDYFKTECFKEQREEIVEWIKEMYDWENNLTLEDIINHINKGK